MNALVKNTLVTGAVATAATTAAIAACGRAEIGNAVAPLNAVSHILFGDEAARVDETTGKHTATGLALNAAAVGLWAGVHELFFTPPGPRRLGPALAGRAATAALAYATDYFLVPDRLTPGFEKRLPGRSLFAIYAALAGSLALGSLLGEASA